MASTRSSLKRKITAILAADIAEYTRITAEDEEETLSRLESYRQVFDDFVIRAGGRVFNSAGDSVMCEFPSAVEATRCAIDIQESLRTRNMDFPANRQMHFRIGISIGDVVERDGDLLGDGVNVAARLQSLAEPGSICVSRNVQEAVANKISLPFVDLGHREVKNLPHPVHAFQIAMNGDSSTSANLSPTAQSMASGTASARRFTAVSIVAALAIVAAGLGALWRGDFDRSNGPPEASGPPKPIDQPLHGQGTSVVSTEGLTPAQTFAKLLKSGGLVRDASSPAELYHNARVLEARGENAAARRDYLALAALETDYLDPLLRLAALIRAQDGRAGSREVFAELAQHESRATRLVHGLQFEGAERQKRLAAFAEAHPEYAPAHYLLALELGEDRQNSQTIAEKRQEQVALTRFLEAEREGRLVPFFLDQSVLSEWIDRAQKREAALRAFFADGRDRISVDFTPTNSGWLGAISLPEPALRLEYRLGSGDEFRSSGMLQLQDPRTGKARPRTDFDLPPQSAPMEMAFRYTDANGLVSPLTTLTFDPVTALPRAMRRQLEGISSAWLSFSGPGHARLMLTTLHVYRCAIEKVEIGFNGQEPHEVIPLPGCNITNPMQLRLDARIMLVMQPSVENVTVRLTFVGGDRSEVKTFKRPAPG